MTSIPQELNGKRFVTGRGYMTPEQIKRVAEEPVRSDFMVNTERWVAGVYEHIAEEPIYIRDKQHLFAECDKRGVVPRAFMKRKSQGKGIEIRRR